MLHVKHCPLFFPYVSHENILELDRCTVAGLHALFSSSTIYDVEIRGLHCISLMSRACYLRCLELSGCRIWPMGYIWNWFLGFSVSSFHFTMIYAILHIQTAKFKIVTSLRIWDVLITGDIIFILLVLYLILPVDG